MVDFIILALIFAYAVYLIVHMLKKQKAGGGCAGCSGCCSGSCTHEFDNFFNALEKAEKKADKERR